MSEMPETPTINRPWWMSGIDEPPLGGLVRSNSVPSQGLVRVSIAAGTGGITLWTLDQSALDTNTTLDF